MTDDEWQTISMLLDKGFKWREPFGEAQAATYKILLDGYQSAQLAGALRGLIASGQVFGPAPGEIVGLIRRDASAPTPEEAYQMIYGPRGVLRARPKPGGSYANEADMLGAVDAARLERAAQLHPLLAAFVQRFGVRRLAMLEVDDPDYGELKRRELRDAWARHCEAFEGREVAAITAGSGRDGLKQLDPLSSLGLAALRQLGPGAGV